MPVQVERMEARNISGEELLSRVKVCEDALATVNHERLSPFNQQEILNRLSDVEKQLKDGGSAQPDLEDEKSLVSMASKGAGMVSMHGI